MGKIRSFEDLEIWQLAAELVEKVYQLTEDFPREERYGLVDQLRRASVSVAGNIAEGFGRFHLRDKVHFYYTSRGSLLEIKSHLLISNRLGFAKNKVLFQNIFVLLDNLGIKLNNCINSLKRA